MKSTPNIDTPCEIYGHAANDKLMEYINAYPTKQVKACMSVKYAEKALDILHTVFTKHGIEFRLLCGTLLGIYRGDGIIPHDLDVDIGVYNNDRDALILILDDLCNDYGFTISPKSRVDIIKVDYNGIRIDIEIYCEYNINSNIVSIKAYNGTYLNIPKSDFLNTIDIPFNGKIYKTINNPEAFFMRYYGDDWKIPLKNKSALLRATKSID